MANRGRNDKGDNREESDERKKELEMMTDE